jgi:hypothetical protein
MMRQALLMRPMSRLIQPAILLAALSLATGCISGRVGGSTPMDVVIDDLRKENLALTHRIQELEKTLANRQAHISTLEQQLKGAQPVAGADVPRAVAISFDRFSGAVDTNSDKRDDLIRIYVKPSDQQGRFLPVSGMASVQAVAIRPQKEPVLIAKAELTLAQWNDAFRSGITGTHYTLELPLPESMPKGVKELTVQVTLVDGATGAELSHQAVMPVR